MNRGDVPIHIA